jgi:hypothetical protein
MSCFSCKSTSCLTSSVLPSMEDMAGSVKKYTRHLLVPAQQPWPSLVKFQDTPKTWMVSAIDHDRILDFPSGKSAPFQADFASIDFGSYNRTAKSYVFVCVHKNRDERCGFVGPLLVNEFKKQLASTDLDVQVHGISHVGGHKFAGNVLIYLPGDKGYTATWYGRVTQCRVADVINQTLINRRIISELLRGTIEL